MRSCKPASRSGLFETPLDHSPAKFRCCCIVLPVPESGDQAQPLCCFRLPPFELGFRYVVRETAAPHANPLGGAVLYFPSDLLLAILEFEQRDSMAKQATPVPTRRPKTPLKIEWRASLRFPNEQDIICHPVTIGPQGKPERTWLGKVRDLSPTGIGLSMSQRFAPGAQLIAELSVKSAATLLLAVRVVHATQDKNGLWIIGCEFMFPLTEDERRTLLGASLSQTSTENPLGPTQPVFPDR
jgi:PilZ domain